jgi:hypothetical protein
MEEFFDYLFLGIVLVVGSVITIVVMAQSKRNSNKTTSGKES